jgi:drug/metabolite transporter (DMT)-like permease
MEQAMASKSPVLLGPALVLLFCVSQAFRDVYFGHAFQGIDFFTVILLAFVASTIIFTAIPLIRKPAAFAKLRGQLATVLLVNMTTALAWSCYFFALSRLEPSVVNTVHSGMAPLTVVALAAFGARIAKPQAVGWVEYAAYTGIALALAALGWVVLSDRSGMAGGGTASLLGLGALLVSGASITVSLLYCKRLQDRGVSAEVVTAVRYLLLIAVAAGAVIHGDGFRGVGSLPAGATLALLATVLIVLPLFAFQVGIGLTAPLTANELRALGPVFVFALQQLDGRLHYSAPTLICILAYSVAAIVGNVAHAAPEQWRLSGGRLRPAPPAARR